MDAQPEDLRVYETEAVAGQPIGGVSELLSRELADSLREIESALKSGSSISIGHSSAT